MRRLAVLTVLALAAPIAAPGEIERPADHVVLVSVDGLRPEFYRDPTWPAATMQEMARDGVSADGVVSVFPSVTYPAHTTMITGALPATHGIVNNSPFEPRGQTGRWYWEEELIRVETLWDAVRAAGLGSASVGWPVSVGAPVDRNVPELWSLEPDRTAIDAMRKATTPAGLWPELEREATGRLTLDNFNYGVMARDDKAGEIAAYLLATYRPALMTVHLVETDDFQHRDGRDGDRVRRAVATADRAVARMREAAERAGVLERTAFVVTGDHGFIEHELEVRPNVWLVEAGLRAAADDRGAWRATLHTGAAAALLYLADPDDIAAAESARAALSGRSSDERPLFTLVERDQLDRLGADPAAVLGLAPAPGVTLASAAEPPAIRPERGGNHGHLPALERMHTGFIAWGSGVRAGAPVGLMHLADVASVVARLLGLDFTTPHGKVPEGILAQ